MKDTGALVSIFVPYYNDSAFLKDCIESILNQSYKNFELILLDHASTDNSPQIAQSYRDQRILHISLKKNLGAGGGILLCEFLKVAKGSYIKLFCADDVMCPDCISTFVDYMGANPQVDIVFGNIQYVDKRLKLLKDNWFNNRQNFSLNDKNLDLLGKFKFCNVLPYIGNFARRKAFEGLEINKTFVIMFDMSLWLEMLLKKCNFAFLDKIIAYYRIHENQVASTVNAEKTKIYSSYESIAYYDYFYLYVKNVAQLKAICPDSPFLEKLGEKDVDLIEFVIAHYFLINQYNSSRINSYLRLEKIFSNDYLRNRIEAKFSYGIAEFRKDFAGIDSKSDSFKRKIYKKVPSELNLGDIIFLFFRSLWDILSLKKIRKRKKYTV